MKKCFIKTFLLFVFSFYFLPGHAQTEVDALSSSWFKSTLQLNENGDMQNKYFFENAPDGYCTFFIDAEHKHLLMEGEFALGEKQGKWVYYFDNGNIDEIVNYKNGIQSGPYLSFYEDGSKKVEAFFSDGLLHGVMTRYRQDGTVVETLQFVNGLPVQQ